MNINKKKLKKVLYIYVTLMLILVFSSRTIYNFSLPKVSADMPKNGSLTKELTAGGVIAFAETMDIYAVTSGQIGDLLMKKGDLIDEGSLIAVLKASDLEAKNAEFGFNIERIMNQLAALTLSRSDTQDKLRALNATPDDLHSYQNNLEDAKAAFARRQTELNEARNAAESAFDDYSYQQAIADAERDLNRKKAELQQAETELALAEEGDIASFDDLTYQQSIEDASIALQRRRAELRDAETALNEARRGAWFDEYSYQAVVETERQVTQAKNAVEDAQRAHNRAVAELDKAKKDFDADTADSQEDNFSNVQKRATFAKMAFEDAQLVYDRAVSARDRAADREAQGALTTVSDAENNLIEAKNALMRAEANLELAQKSSVGQVDALRKSLELELRRVDLDIEKVRIDLRAAEASAPDGGPAAIISDYGGVVVSLEKTRGQFVAQGEKIATIGVDRNTFICEISCPETEGRFIDLGDEVSISANGVMGTIKAAVTDITLVGDTLKISLLCETDAFKGGEFVSVKFHKQTINHDVIVPNEAVFRDGTSNYVWVIRGRMGALGIEYYTVRIKVLIADSDEFYTAISRGLEFFEPVVVSFNKDLTVNGRVSRLE